MNEQNANLVFRLLETKDIPSAARCLAEVFAQREPLSLSLGFTYDDIKDFSLLACEQAAQEKLGMLAIDPLSNQIIGCMVCQDFRGNGLAFERIPSNDKMNIVLAVLDELEKSVAHMTQEKGIICHGIMLAVSSDFLQAGVATQLMLHTFIYLKQKGFQYYFAEYTSPYSYKMIKRLDGNMGIDLSVIDFNTFLFKGQTVLKNHIEKAILRINDIAQILNHST